jgi:hypothetical protein
VCSLCLLHRPISNFKEIGKSRHSPGILEVNLVLLYKVLLEWFLIGFWILIPNPLSARVALLGILSYDVISKMAAVYCLHSFSGGYIRDRIMILVSNIMFLRLRNLNKISI